MISKIKKSFGKYFRNNKTTKYTCNCCGYKTLSEEPHGTYEICDICFWEDDYVQFKNPNSKGANHVSLKHAQKNFIKFGASELKHKSNVREPNKKDVKDV